MGRGNWFPKADRAYDLVYVEILDLDHDVRDQLEIDWAYHDFQRLLASCLPESFYPVKRYRNDSVVLYENDLFTIEMDTQGDWWHHGLAIVVKDDAPQSAEEQLESFAAELWRKLYNNGYELRRRNGAWLSTRYVPEGVDAS